jgi:hypothetical protein
MRQQATRDQQNIQMLQQIIGQQDKMQEQNFQLLRDMVETTQCTIAVLTRLEQKIDSNNFCPMLREMKKQ